MGKFKVIHTFGDVLCEGERKECDAVVLAFARYGVTDSIRVEEVFQPKLTESTKEEVIFYLVEIFNEGIRYKDICDIIVDGYTGLNEKSDEELIEILSENVDLDDLEASNTMLYMKALAELEFENLLHNKEVL